MHGQPHIKDEEVEVFLGLLQEEFKITIVSLENFLGMQIKCQGDGPIFVSQEAYTNKILQKFNMAEAKRCVDTCHSQRKG